MVKKPVAVGCLVAANAVATKETAAPLRELVIRSGDPIDYSIGAHNRQRRITIPQSNNVVAKCKCEVAAKRCQGVPFIKSPYYNLTFSAKKIAGYGKIISQASWDFFA